tara:strand:- start:17540 stop:19780 length:2241 start_codon:yes stop_codon:yes gene_type:complete
VVNSHFVVDPLKVWLIGAYNALTFSALALLIISPIYLIKNRKVINVIVGLVLCFLLLFDMVSMLYYNVTLSPINKALLRVDGDQMSMIAGDFIVFKWYYLLLITPVPIYVIISRILRDRSISKWIVSIWFISILSILIIGFQLNSGKSVYKALGHNKSYHFLKSILTSNSQSLISNEEAIKLYQDQEGRNFTNSSYPLIHESSNKNTLGPFIELTEKPPNIVLIIVESLSSSFSGKEADEISYTPFLDSLSDHSLVFENTLATGERTFAALPSILGSLPHGRKGFTQERIGFPRSNSLFKFLISMNYSSQFYYGGNARFDYMDMYLKDQGIDRINDHKNYRTDNIVEVEGQDPAPFGDSDKKIFERISKDDQLKENPYLDIILTLSMHYPFIVENQEQYLKQVQRTINDADVPGKLKEKHLIYKEAFASMIYTDDVLKSYFRKRAGLKEHKNTIYLITGDHMMTDIPHGNTLEKYRVPLLIYSPLLKRKKRIKAVNSHLDITPSLVSLLSTKYEVNTEKSHWLGSTFDTLGEFRNLRSIAFMRNKRTYNDFISNELFLSDGELFTVSDRLNIHPSESKTKSEQIKTLFDAYKRVHSYSVLRNKITPGEKRTTINRKKASKISIENGMENKNVHSLKLDDNHAQLGIDIELSLLDGWHSTDKELDESQPILIATVDRNDKNILWDVLQTNLSENEIDQKKTITYLIKESDEISLKKGDELNIYFWNKEKNQTNFRTVFHKIEVYEFE